MSERAEIHFRGSNKTLTIEGSADALADQLSTTGPARVTTIHGSVAFVNWSNVLYIEDVEPPAGVAATPRY